MPARFPAPRGYRFLLFATRPPPQFPYGLGQPIHETRAHLVKSGDITPGISAMEYFQRRVKLGQKLPANSVAIVSGSKIKYASGPVFFPFQQNNDLLYLLGWNEPELIIAIEVDGNHETTFHMIVPAKNPQRDLWEGDKLGTEGAYDVFNADEVVENFQGPRHLKELVERAEHIFINADKADLASPQLVLALSQIQNRVGVKLITPLIAAMRAVKLKAEQNVMKAAGASSSRAINLSIAAAGNGGIRQEKVLAKLLDYQFIVNGCDTQAYVPVVALGKNALTIHYTRNDDLMYDDEMVFVDAGGKLGGYCADVSRGWPNLGKFTEAQRDIYLIVLEANKACIDECHSGNSLHSVHEKLVHIMWQGLKQLPGFDSVSKTDVVRQLYPHYVGHHLGLDLHDVPLVLRFDQLKSGNVITIEPGLYIPEDDKWPKHFHGIGVRVEDDVIIGSGADDMTNMTAGCVKEIVDIESVIANGVTTPDVGKEVVEVGL